jgi:hypothetical protein
MGPALKDSTNPAFKTKYADLASVMAACMPALNRHGICVIQPICDEDGKRYVKTVLAHESGETLECRVELIVGKNDMQGYGSAVTYARRYGLMAMAGIAPDDDDGNAAANDVPVSNDRPKPPMAVDVACDSLINASSLDQLSAIWKDLPRSVQGEARVIAAKDKRKTELTPSIEDLSNVPY